MGLLLLMVLLLISVYTCVLYQNFSRNMLEAVLTRDTTSGADAIHRTGVRRAHTGRILRPRRLERHDLACHSKLQRPSISCGP